MAKAQLHLTGQQIGHIGSAIGHVNDVHAGHHPEQLEGEMRRRAGALRRQIELARIGFGIGDEFWNCLHRDRRTDHDDEGRVAEERHRHDIADEIEIEVGIERGIGSVAEIITNSV